MAIDKLSITRFRNFEQAELNFHPRLNIFTGDNGSGKSSLLEAIYYLGMGRSFRSNRPSKVIRYGDSDFVVFAALQSNDKVGLKKDRAGKTLLKVNGSLEKSQSKLSNRLPLLLLHPDGYSVIDGGPKYRRAYIDWGLFHVEPLFHEHWLKYKRLLKQRNALLRQGASYRELSYWDSLLAPCAETIASLREQYIKDIHQYIQQCAEQFLPEYELSIDFVKGWDSKQTLLNLLESNYLKDRQVGYSQIGAHKADLKIKLNAKPAVDVVSRGQQKLLVCALLLAQVQHLNDKLNKPTIFLIDDFAAELDEKKRELLALGLQKNNAQVFVTSIDSKMLNGFDLNQCQRFHVKHGTIE